MLSPTQIESLIFAINFLSNNKNHEQAFQLGTIAIEHQAIQKDILRTIAASAFHIKKETQLITLLEKTNTDFKDYTVLQMLAGLYGRKKDDKTSTYYAMKASAAKSAFPSKKKKKLNLLILQTIATGGYVFNPKTKSFTFGGVNNLDSVLDKSNIAISYLRVDNEQAAIDGIKQLPNIDLIYNSVSEPDRAAAQLVIAEKVSSQINKPIINQPNQVLTCNREMNEKTLATSNIVLPKIIKIENTQQPIEYHLRQLSFREQQNYLIVRLSGYQAGKYMHLVENPDTHNFSELNDMLTKKPHAIYFIEYHHVGYQDERLPNVTLYPKYRAVFVGNKLYPAHLFTANGYNVHIANSKQLMQDNPWLIEKEKDYCRNAPKHIGTHLWRDLENSLSRLGLDYVGVDFALTTDKKLVIFEANPAMRNRTTTLPKNDHVQQAWREITLATHRLFCERAKIEKWEFNISRGLEK